MRLRDLFRRRPRPVASIDADPLSGVASGGRLARWVDGLAERLRIVAGAWRRSRYPETRSIDSVPWDTGGGLPTRAVSVDQALSLAPVFACIRLLADQIASLPLQTYRQTGDTRTRIPTGSLFTAPTARGTLYDWLHRCVVSLATRGNAYGLITARDSYQYPTMIEWLSPDDVYVYDRATSGRGSYTDPIYYWQGREVPREDLVHIAWFSVPFRVKGLSPIEAFATTIGTGVSAQAYTSDWFDNGAVPPGVMKNTEQKLSQEQAEVIKARTVAAIRTRKPLVHGADWDYKPISVSSNEAKFVETLKLNATQVASIYGVPPEKVGGESGGPLTYNTQEQNALDFTKFGLRTWLELLEAAFSALLPRPQYVKFNIDALLRTDLAARYAAYKTAREIGLMSIDEIRALEDLPPLPNGAGADYTPLEVLVKAAGPAPTPAPDNVLPIRAVS